MAERIRAHDWSATPLGPIDDWPDVLKTTLSLCLDSSFPQAVMWGDDLLTLHNDAFSPILGKKPSALGRPFGDVWKEVWDDIRPIAERALAGQSTFIEDFPLTIDRGGNFEHAYFTFCYSPIRDRDGHVVGMLDTVAETTATVLTNQRLSFLDTLTRAIADLTEPDSIMRKVTGLLGEHMRLSNCAYADMDADGNGLNVRGDWTAPGATSLVGHHRLEDFGHLAVSRLGAGEALEIADNLHELPPSEAAAFQTFGISATLCMPLIRDGRLTALMAAHDSKPRFWSASERMLVAEVTQRCWAHIERARIELQLRELNDCLEERVAMMVAQNEAEVAEHHETRKMELIGQLTGGVAHDFNNLLTPIIGTLELIRRRLADEHSQELVDRALLAADRARILVARLLTFARRQTLQPRVVELGILLNGMLDLIRRSLGPRIDVLVEAPGNLPAIMVDPHQLELAVLNLAVNARDAIEQAGRLRLSAGLADLPSAAVKGLRGGRYVRLVVRDDGRGMGTETLARCTEPFFSTKRPGEGTGLGLSMVQGLMMQSGGGLSIESEVGKGTAVSLWLPITEERATREEVDACEAPMARGTVRVLLVDDEDAARHTTAMQLLDLGYQVIEAASAEAALEQLEACLSVDVLVTDYLMADQSGVQLANHARRLNPDLPVLIITGYSNLPPSQMQDFDILRKPFRYSEIAESLAQLLK